MGIMSVYSWALILSGALVLPVQGSASSSTSSLTFVSLVKKPSNLKPSIISNDGDIYTVVNGCHLPTIRQPLPLLQSKCLSYTLVFNYCHCRHINIKHTVLYSSIKDGATQENIIERLELHRQFERWRFMQKLLEAELTASDIEDVLLLTLRAYLQHGPTESSLNNKNENGGNASPVLTGEQRNAMEDLIDAMVSVSDGIGDSRFLHMLVLPPVDYENMKIDLDETSPEDDDVTEIDPTALSILEQMERLLPDPIEDEEAHKGAWDVVMNLYGRESVRVREEALQKERESNIVHSNGSSISMNFCTENLQWRTLCAVGRVLIHYDFLTKGVLKEGTFNESATSPKTS